MAVEHYHEQYKCYPPGQCGGQWKFGPDSTAWSWLARILPYIEEATLYKQGDVPKKTLKESGIAAQQRPLFLCPSDGYSNRGVKLDAGNLKDFPVGQTNYKGVSGANWGADESLKTDDIDGSVRFISAEIDLKTYRALATRAGNGIFESSQVMLQHNANR